MTANRTLVLDRIAPLVLALLCAGDAIAAFDIVVPISVLQAAPRGSGTPRSAQVAVTDLRTVSNLERTGIGGVSMGRITLQPSAPELVQAVIEAKADEVLARRGELAPQTVRCGIRDFEVATPSTLLYWDVRARIELVVRVRGRDRSVSGTASERTFVWPTQDLIGRVTTTALQRVGVEAGQALEELFAARP